MRIIGGKYSGRQLVAPKGRDTRPTADRARESLFNLLAHRADFSFDGARVIDLYAGSGALGFEAISRGADFCLFVETDHEARGAIRNTIEALNLFGATRLHRRSAASLGPKPSGVGGSFTLAFIDPPYRLDLVRPTLESLKSGDWLTAGAIVIIEQGENEDPALIAGFEEVDRRVYGAAQIGVLRFEG